MENVLDSSRYETIISFICSYYKIEKDEFIEILKDRQLKYMFFLLLKKYRCTDLDKLTEELPAISKKSVNYNLRKAEEKFFVNREFREAYFEMEELIEKII
jgi:hypothetical protein